MIGIRVDANKHIATGHLMRCLSIADAFFSLHKEVVFFTSDDLAEEMIANYGFSVIRLKTEWNAKESELEQFEAELNHYPLDFLLIDSYQITVKYLKSLKKIVKIVYLDDLNTFDYPVDVVVNYSIYAEEISYPKGKRYLLGTQYTPLRQQFYISDEKLEGFMADRRFNKQIMITTGASDPYRIAINVVKEIMKEDRLRDYKIVVVRGRFWDVSAQDIYKCVNEKKGRGYVVVLENVENMAEIMLESTFAVSAGGSTLYELSACCVPTVTFSYVDNQLQNVESFCRKGIMEYVGDARVQSDICRLIVDKLILYVENEGVVREAESKMKGLQCRYGAINLAKELLVNH